MFHSLISIAAGATLGAWCRWALGLWLNPHSGQVPLGTLAANLLGGYAVGLTLAWLDTHPSLSPQWRLFVVTGLLGGLTTFSTFSAETVQLIGRQQYGWAVVAVAGHVLGSFAMTVAGFITVRVVRG